MMNKIFKYKVNLLPLDIPNAPQDIFRAELNGIPYLLYQVEEMKNGSVIAINKPGGKRNFGKLSRDDFMVFIFDPYEESLWLISHDDISDDISEKYAYDEEEAFLLVKGLYKVCCGEEPDDVIAELGLQNTVGIDVETILKVYKWIWGQEDCNYPTQKGRWLSMEAIMHRFGLCEEDLK